MALGLTLAGADKSNLVEVGSLRLSARLNARSRLSFALILGSGDTANTTPGAEVILTGSDGLLTEAGGDLLTEGGEELALESSERHFGGFVDSVTEALVIEGNTATIRYEVESVSYDALCDRRLVAATYESPTQTLSTIVTDVVTNHLTGDGLTTTNVDTGPVIDKLKFNYEAASQVFNELANLTGYAWWVDEYKNLYFKPRSGVVAPISIDATNARKVTVSRTVETYRNKQLIRAGVDLTASRTENLTGDGTRKAFTLSYPVGAVPTSITVGGVGKTVGVRGVDSGKDWYYQIADAVISQDDGAAAVGSGTAIAVTYQGQFPIIVNAQIDSQISTQAATSGTSGVYEAIEQRPNINDDEAASDVALGLLRRYGAIPRRLTFETDEEGLKPGQLVPATFTPHSITGSWLVDVVNASDRNGQELVWQVEALDGESVGGWANFFAALAGAGQAPEFRENEVVVLLRSFTETVSLTDSATFTTAAPESRVEYAIVGYSEVGV